MAGTSAEKTFETGQIVILGASGDLVSRLLLPGLASLMTVHQTFEPRLVGVDRTLDAAGWRDLIRKSLATVGEARVERIAEASHHQQRDLTDADDLRGLLESLDEDALLYFALPASVTETIVRLLADIDLPRGMRIALEKPIGTDEESARSLNEAAARILPEERIFRVDHFLGNSLVLNILGLRFANRLFEPLWNREHIEWVEIVFDETLTVEGRGEFYDSTGALVDMLQSHLLLVAAIVAMDEPTSIDHIEFRDLLSHALRATEIFGGDPRENSRRARYTAGRIGTREVPDYIQEAEVDAERETETLAEVALEVHTQRWAGVPFTLRSGKALGANKQVVRLHFRPVPVIPRGLDGDAVPNVLELDLANGSIRLTLASNAAGSSRTLEEEVLTGEVGEPGLEPYGEVLAGMLAGDPLLSVRGDIAERCWAILQPVIDAWQRGDVPLDEYAAGSDGPEGWDAPLAADER